MINVIKKSKLNKGFICGIAGIVTAILLFFVVKNSVFGDSIQPMALVVSTGIADGSCVGFFGVEYEDENGNLYTHYVFPHDGDYEKTYKIVKEGGGKIADNRQDIFREIGYEYATWEDVANIDALESYSEDVFVFKPHHKVAAIKNIYIYSDIAAGTAQSWDCAELSVYRVNQFYDMQMYGYASNQIFLSFEGDLMAYFEKRGETFSTASDRIYELSPNSQKYKLNTTIVSSTKYSNFTEDEYIFKVDIADVYGAGIEAFTNNERKTLNNLQMPEVLNMQVIYKCTDGRRQLVNIPMITSSAASAIENGKGTEVLVDFAGQGESLVAVGKLPFLEKLESVKLIYGPENALKESGLSEVGNSSLRQEKAKRIKDNEDYISISGISVYKNSGESKLTYDKENDTILTPVVTGEPIYYYVADSYRGVELGVNKSSSFSMKDYTSGVRLQPVDNQKKYLAVIDTAKISTSASRQRMPDVTMQLTYLSTNGNEVKTEEYKLSEITKEYYGYVPNTSNENCAYPMNIYAGGQLSVVLSLSDVEKFTAVKFSVLGANDEWQMVNFGIYLIDTMSSRKGKWLESEKEFFGQKAKFTYYREINGSKELLKSAELFNAPLEILFQNGESKTIEFSSLNVVDAGSSLDWMAEDKYYLEYKNASANYLGFYEAKVNYQVDVKVADNSTNSLEDGDSGSKNYFYFQLIFKNGNSAVVQANQMLEADGFLTGQTATFNISTNYDYGELVAIRVIPDDFSSKADPYDKLNIDYIDVTKKAKTGYATVWTVASVGWIGIDYVDDGEEKSGTTPKGRTMEELGYVYYVTGSSAGVELQFAITTGAYSQLSGGNQFVGSVMAEIGYADANGSYKTVSLDVVQAMYNYANKTAATVAGNNKRESNPGFMFLENRTNRFTCFINDISELLDIRLYVYSDKGGTLNVSSISAALVVEEGPLSINVWGEYEKNSSLFPLTKNANPITPFNVGESMSANANISFKSTDKSMLIGLVNGTWPYEVNPDISISEDYLNIFVYPENEINAEINPTLRVSLDYSDSFGQGYRIQQNLNYNKQGNNAGYYSLEKVRASDLEAIKEIKIEKILGDSDVEVGDIIIQKIREDQIVQTSKYNMDGKKASLSPTVSQTVSEETSGESQQAVLSFSRDMNEKTIVPGEMDVAVALVYTSIHDPSGTEYITPYVYLSKDGKKSISGGESATFDFTLQNLDKVVGISVAATGGMSVKVDGATVATYSETNGLQEMEEWYSVCESGEITNGSKKFKVTTNSKESVNTMIPIEMTIKTGTENGQNTGTDAPIRMIMHYEGFDNNPRIVEIPDIRKYTVSGDYNSNSEAVIRMMLPNVKDISTLTFEPYDKVVNNTEMWKLSEVNINYGVTGAVKKAQISLADEDAFAYEGTPARVALKRVVVKLHYKENDATETIMNSGKGCIREINEPLQLWMEVENSNMNGEITVYEVIDENRRNVTDKYLSSVADSNVKIFNVPSGAIASDTKFEIVASSKEMPEFQSVLSVTVKVP